MQEIIAQNIPKGKEKFNATALHDVQNVQLFIFQTKSLNSSLSFFDFNAIVLSKFYDNT